MKISFTEFSIIYQDRDIFCLMCPVCNKLFVIECTDVKEIENDFYSVKDPLTCPHCSTSFDLFRKNTYEFLCLNEIEKSEKSVLIDSSIAKQQFDNYWEELNQESISLKNKYIKKQNSFYTEQHDEIYKKIIAECEYSIIEIQEKLNKNIISSDYTFPKELISSSYYIWNDGIYLNLYIVNADNMLFNKVTRNIIKIHLRDIVYFKEYGNIENIPITTGGDSTDINLSGAIVGGIIAGNAGAILGGSRKINEIRTDIVTKNTKEIIMLFSINDKKHYISCPYKYLPEFNRILPTLNYDIKSLKPQLSVIDVREKLTFLKELFEDNLIDELEYKSKKSELLSKIQ